MTKTKLNIMSDIGKSMITGIPYVIAVGSSKAYHAMVSATSQCMTASVKESDLTDAQKEIIEGVIDKGTTAANKVKIEKHLENELTDMLNKSLSSINKVEKPDSNTQVSENLKQELTSKSSISELTPHPNEIHDSVMEVMLNGTTDAEATS